MMTDMIFKHLGHQAVDTAADVRKKHENIRTIVLGGKRAFDGLDLPANPLDAGDEFQLFFINVRHGFLCIS